MLTKFDINSDMGESYGRFKVGNDERVIPCLTTANLGCGFHGGDPVTISRTIALAKRHGVEVGAHFGLPDIMGFGRRAMKLTTEEMKAYAIYQIGAVKAFAEAAGLRLQHAKPHGALFDVLRDEAMAEAALDGIRTVDPELMIFWPTPIDKHAFTVLARQKGMRVVGEIYVDMPYGPDGFLAPRPVPSGDPKDAVRRVLRFLKEGVITAENGQDFTVEANSLCIHGDGPFAVELLEAIRGALSEAGVVVVAARTFM